MKTILIIQIRRNGVNYPKENQIRILRYLKMRHINGGGGSHVNLKIQKTVHGSEIL